MSNPMQDPAMTKYREALESNRDVTTRHISIRYPTVCEIDLMNVAELEGTKTTSKYLPLNYWYHSKPEHTAANQRK